MPTEIRTFFLLFIFMRYHLIFSIRTSSNGTCFPRLYICLRSHKMYRFLSEFGLYHIVQVIISSEWFKSSMKCSAQLSSAHFSRDVQAYIKMSESSENLLLFAYVCWCVCNVCLCICTVCINKPYRMAMECAKMFNALWLFEVGHLTITNRNEQKWLYDENKIVSHTSQIALAALDVLSLS